MKTIWKFGFHVADDITLEMPTGAHLLEVGTQTVLGREEPMLWAIVDSDAPMVDRKLALRGTGHNADGLDAATHVSSFMMMGGQLVFHLFDLGEVKS